MHLAILMTNTDESAFAEAHQKDGEKFTALVQRARAEWTTEVFEVKDGVFPDDIARFDGLIVTGSPHSVNSGAPWVGRLLEVIRAAVATGQAVFGACFGHQAIAMALGGTVGDNPGGMVHGLTEVRLMDQTAGLPEVMYLYASHKEQVTALPEGARVVAASAGCPVAGLAVGRHVWTTQHHPEITAEFFAALTDAFAGELGEAVAARGHASMVRRADMDIFAEALAQFFEQAQPSAAMRSMTVT